MRRIVLAVAVATIAAVVLIGAGPAGAGTKNTCPPNPPPGATLNGGLLVTGPCVLNNVTVHGGATITSTGGLELENSTIDGGVNIQAGGELDSGHLLSSFFGTFNPSTINGGIDSQGPIKDIDLDNATVNGNVTIISNAPGFAPYVCGSTIHGTLSISGVSAAPFFSANLGDPGEFVQGGPVTDCPGNTIDGSVFITNDLFLEVEANTIHGSVFIDSSTVDLRGNDISGSVHCNAATFYTDDGLADASLAPNTCS